MSASRSPEDNFSDDFSQPVPIAQSLPDYSYTSLSVPQKDNILAILGATLAAIGMLSFVFTHIMSTPPLIVAFGPLGLIFSILGLRESKKTGFRKNLAIDGIELSIINIIVVGFLSYSFIMILAM